MIDTHSGAGRQTTNRIDCLVRMGRVWPFARQVHLASFFVASHARAQSVEGSLIMDFGNSGCSFIFSETGSGAMSSPVVALHNPFDAEYRKRTPDQLVDLQVEPDRAEGRGEPEGPALARDGGAVGGADPATSAGHLHLRAKKYIRDWPKHLESRAPKSLYRGVIGHRPDLHPRLEFVKEGVSQLLELVLSSLTNPKYAAHSPVCSPQFQRVMLTYPLTWRESDKALFARLVKDEVLKLIDLPEPLRAAFQVELICSEPVAVAAYVLWETIFQFGHANLALAASSLGNTSGSPGAAAAGRQHRRRLDRYRPGRDRLPSPRERRLGGHHLQAAGVDAVQPRRRPALAHPGHGDLVLPADQVRPRGVRLRGRRLQPGLRLEYRRQAISEFSRLAEQAKVAISQERSWSLDRVNEAQVLRCFEVLGHGVNT